MRFNPIQLLYGDRSDYGTGCSSCQNRAAFNAAPNLRLSNFQSSRCGGFGCGCRCASEPCSQTLTFCTSTPTIIGCTRPFCTIVLQIEQQRYEVAADQVGIWTVSILQSLALGSHRATVTEYCNCTRQKDMLIYIFPENTVSIVSPPNNAVLVSSPTDIAGTATPFAPVTISVVDSFGGTTTLNATADTLGSYTAPVIPPLPAGQFVINAQSHLSPCPPATSTFTVET